MDLFRKGQYKDAAESLAAFTALYPNSQLAPSAQFYQGSSRYALKDFKGKWLVLYFYPKDKTPGCSKEAANFRDRQDQYGKLNAAVVGVSLDDVASHKDFADTLKLPFTLLSDSDKSTAKAYDVLFEMGPMTYTERQTFLINPDGTIVKHYPKVNPDSHADEVLKDLAALQKS